MYCQFCGNKIPDDSEYCPECHSKIPDDENYADQSNTEIHQDQEAKEPFLIRSFHLDCTSFSCFINSIRDLSGVNEDAAVDGDPFERNVPIVPNCIQPEADEKVVKQYNIAKLRTRLKGMKAEGRLMVTNRRILFRATGTSLTGNIAQEHQFNIDELGGIEIHKDYKFSILSFLGCLLLTSLITSLFSLIFLEGNSSLGAAKAIGIIFGILGIVPTFIVYKHFWLKLICSAISCEGFLVAYGTSGVRFLNFFFRSYAKPSGNGFLLFLFIIAVIVFLIDLIIVCFVPNLVIRIKTKGALGAIDIGSQKSMFRRKTGDDYSGFAEVLPWEDTVLAMNELGTMIDDLQKLGDYAIEKWSK